MQSTLKRDPETWETLDGASNHRKFLLKIRDKAGAEKGKRKKPIPYINVDDFLARAPSAHKEVVRLLLAAMFRNKRDHNLWFVVEKGNLKLRAGLYDGIKDKVRAPVPDNITESYAELPLYLEFVENEKIKNIFFIKIQDGTLYLLKGEEQSFNEALRALGIS